MSRALTAADDRFHPVADTNPLWTETTWWGFMVPEGELGGPMGGMVYTLFRPNLGVATLVVQVWNAAAVEPWRSPYARQLWHVPMPSGDLDDAEVGLLRIRCLESLSSYRLTYADGDSLTLDLRYDAVMEPNNVAATEAFGHFDQLCRVTGSLALGPEEIAVDCHAVRDRSWYVRDDLRSMRSGYTYGAVDPSEHFLAFSRPAEGDDTDPMSDDYPIFGGYLVRDGEKATIAEGLRRVVSRRRGHPDQIEVTAVDEQGRRLGARGTVAASLASQSTPGMFAWMSIARWEIDGRAGHGEDHDVWSPDRLAARNRAGTTT
jgi:hypothetical protein